MIVDAHHHFWDTSDPTYDYYWMTDDLSAIQGRFFPEDMRPLLRERGVDRTVLIQTIPSLPESRDFLAIAARTDFVAGVVGWVDLADGKVGDTLAGLQSSADGRWLKGIRHQAHDEADADWLRRPDVKRGVEAVGAAGLTYDILVRDRELPAALDLVSAFPGQRFVVDHIAKPSIKDHEIEPWASLMKPLAEYPTVWVKVSGMIEEADWGHWTPDDLKPYVQRLLEWFGPERLIFGSNWPVCLLAGSYAQVFDALVYALGDIPPGDRDRIFGGNAIEAYRLDGTSAG
jgi:L-fuconolactonase